ncbi:MULTISPECIES: manganese efflux pump MntP family protein [unclassified Turicibacter]|uniref:manganese efflux pump MntP n=1 Tax=unclassified Turicibacter TaxID=2638206 RepID=UPI001F45B7CF|nr:MULTISPECIES: manganese efflux pump [unclassified Turicibacter]MCU7205431.1 manganese efflux pump [Turicibacter sp. TA25]MCU7208934.1 manganese efflux pump [Turicibacter sp. 1E2]
MNNYLVIVMLMSIALAMDAFAVSVTLGMDGMAHRWGNRLKIAGTFGFFQGLLFILGLLSLRFVSGEVTVYNHLIAGAILIVLGVRMIKEALDKSGEGYIEVSEKKLSQGKQLSFKVIAAFGIVTSIDALAAGITYGLIYDFFIVAVLCVSFVALFLSYIGLTFGKKLGSLIGNKANILGGLMVILLGMHAIFFN